MESSPSMAIPDRKKLPQSSIKTSAVPFRACPGPDRPGVNAFPWIRGFGPRPDYRTIAEPGWHGLPSLSFRKTVIPLAEQDPHLWKGRMAMALCSLLDWFAAVLYCRGQVTCCFLCAAVVVFSGSGSPSTCLSVSFRIFACFRPVPRTAAKGGSPGSTGRYP